MPSLNTTPGGSVSPTTPDSVIMSVDLPGTTIDNLPGASPAGQGAPSLSEAPQVQINPNPKPVEPTTEPKTEPKTSPQLVRNEKGQIKVGVAQDTNKYGTAGRPCIFCVDKEKYLLIVSNYLAECQRPVNNKTKYPSIAELADRLGVYRQRMSEWEERKTEKGELEHPEFSDYIKKVRNLQFYWLEMRLLGRYNPTGSIFLMKTQHGMIETEKKLLAGDKDEPLQIEIIDDKKLDR